MDISISTSKNDKKLKELGASMMEAVLLIALISIVAMGSARAVGQKTLAKFETVENQLRTGAGYGPDPDAVSSNNPF